MRSTCYRLHIVEHDSKEIGYMQVLVMSKAKLEYPVLIYKKRNVIAFSNLSCN
jgi:hypothetical protein